MGEANTEAMCLHAAWMCVMSTTKSTSTLEPSLPRNAVIVTTSSGSARVVVATACGGRTGERTIEAGGKGGSGLAEVSFACMAGGALRRLVGVNQLDDDDDDDRGGAAEWKDGDAGDGGGGFRNPNMRATMLGDAGSGSFAVVPLLLGGGANSGCALRWVAAIGVAGALSTTRDHRMESSGRKQMQKRKK